jgi:hypothetical protein
MLSCACKSGTKGGGGGGGGEKEGVDPTFILRPLGRGEVMGGGVGVGGLLLFCLAQICRPTEGTESEGPSCLYGTGIYTQ